MKLSKKAPRMLSFSKSVFVVIIITFLLIGFFIGNAQNKKIQTEYTSIQTVASQKPESTVSEELMKTKKITHDFKLKEYNGYLYKLQWDQYDIDEKDVSIDNILVQANYSSPLRLIKSADNFKSIILVKVLDLNFRVGYFNSVNKNVSANEIFFTQSQGFNSAKLLWLINLDNGDVRSAESEYTKLINPE